MRGHYIDLTESRQPKKHIPDGKHKLRKAIFINKSKQPSSSYTDLMMKIHYEYKNEITTISAQNYTKKQEQNWMKQPGFICIAEGPNDFILKFKQKFKTNMVPDYDILHQAFYTSDFEKEK